MLCCLLVGMLFAQIAAVFRRGRARLGLRPARRPAIGGARPAGALWSRQAVMVLTGQLVAVAILIMHWDHVSGLVRTAVLTPTQTLAFGRLCSAGQAVHGLDHATASPRH